MLGRTLERARGLVPRERTLAVVATDHRRWWGSELAEFPAKNILVQPRNRGTAAGILLPILEILRRDPTAVIVSFPSDHHFENEIVLEESLIRAVRAVEAGLEGLVLLGITPDFPETEYGWILPYSDEENTPVLVGSFVEKPPGEVATDLMRAGALWNSFIWIGRADTVLGLFDQALPDLRQAFSRSLDRCRGRWTVQDLDDLYSTIPSFDFSSDLLERSQGSLWVLRVPRCGWSDLGTPERVQRCLERNGAEVVPAAALRIEELPATAAS